MNMIKAVIDYMHMQNGVSDEKERRIIDRERVQLLRDDILLLKEQLNKEAIWRADTNFSVVGYQTMIEKIERQGREVIYCCYPSGCRSRSNAGY